MENYHQLFEGPFEGNNIYSTILFLAIIAKWAIDLFSKNSNLLNYIIFKQYRFQRLQSHSNILESLEFIEDKNLEQLHKGMLKKETFEKITGIKFYSTKLRELFLELYPQIQVEFGNEGIYKLRKHISINKGKLFVFGRPYYIIQDILYSLIVGVPLFGVFGIFSLYFTNSFWGDGLWWIPLLVFIGLMIIRIETSINAGKLRVLLEKHYS